MIKFNIMGIISSKKRGGTTFEKGGGNRPPVPPPLNPPLATRCPTLDVSFPFILPGWKAEKTQTGFLMVSPKTAMDRRQAGNED